MGDLEWILLVLAAFYVVETAHWVLPGAVVFVGHGGRRLRPRMLDITPTFRNAGGGVLFGSLLPWGESVVASPCPLSIDDDGVLGFTAHHLGHDARPADDGPVVAWDELRDVVVEGREIRLAGRRLVTADSPATAARLVEFLQRSMKAGPAQRSATLDAFHAAWFDDCAFADELEAGRRACRFLRITCTSLFLHFFVLLPVIVGRGWGIFFLYWVAGYAVLLTVHLAAFHLAHRRLHRADRAERWKRLLLMLISPADAARSRSRLLRDVAVLRHPLCVAVVSCSADDAALSARRTLRDLRSPQLPNCADSPRGRRIDEAFRRRVLNEALGLLRRRGLDPADFERPPQPDAPDSAAFCPRCEQQFRESQGTCAACGLAAVPYPASSSGGSDPGS